MIALPKRVLQGRGFKSHDLVLVGLAMQWGDLWKNSLFLVYAFFLSIPCQADLQFTLQGAGLKYQSVAYHRGGFLWFQI